MKVSPSAPQAPALQSADALANQPRNSRLLEMVGQVISGFNLWRPNSLPALTKTNSSLPAQRFLRRTLLQRAIPLATSMPLIGALLEACDSQPASPVAQPAQPTRQVVKGRPFGLQDYLDGNNRVYQVTVDVWDLNGALLARVDVNAPQGSVTVTNVRDGDLNKDTAFRDIKGQISGSIAYTSKSLPNNEQGKELDFTIGSAQFAVLTGADGNPFACVVVVDGFAGSEVLNLNNDGTVRATTAIG
jgi:hypothetical protein